MVGLAWSLDKFDSDRLSATRANWGSHLKRHKDQFLASEYQRILDWTEDHIDYQGNSKDTFAYGIFADSAKHADAIVEIIYAKSGKQWLKLLSLHLCPSAELSFETQSFDIAKVAGIFSAAVTGTVKLTSTAHPTKVTKLYGRSGTLLAFLQGLGSHIQANGGVKGLKVSLEGRWLVFRT